MITLALIVFTIPILYSIELMQTAAMLEIFPSCQYVEAYILILNTGALLGLEIMEL